MVKRALGWMSVAGFGLSLLAHLLAVAGLVVLLGIRFVWLLHLGMLILWVTFILSSWNVLRRRPTFGDILTGIPRWAAVLLAVAFIYGFVNAIVGLSALGNGGPDVWNGQYVLASHGRVVAHISESEYYRYRAYELRMFSSGWLLFYGVPAVYFLLWKEPTSPAELAPRIT